MKVFLVGGAVRDLRLGLKVKDHDFVVVGSTPEEMLSLGFEQVGSDFPVFLHPVTRDEYALARTERKSGSGYHGFTVDASPEVTLEEDLERRDLTINAMALPVEIDMKTGKWIFGGEFIEDHLIDPFNGKQDVDDGILRHVSDAFKDDPVRVLRVARFAARYGFDVDCNTITMMQDMVKNGELNHLTAERVWLELDKALGEKNPKRFFDVLRITGACEVVLPEIEALFGIPQPPQWHPEIDTGIHTMMVLEQTCKLTTDKRVRFAALVHDLGKAITPKDKLPSHPGHEEEGVPLVEAMCDRLKAPNDFRDLAVKVCRWHLHIHKAFEMKPKTYLKVFEGLDVFRKPELFQLFLDAVESDARGRLGLEDRNYFQRVLFEQAFIGALRVSAQPFVEQGLKGKDIGEAVRIARIAAIRRKITKLKRMLKEDV